MNNFESASRLKLRFDTPQGVVCVEDLWVLPLTTANETKASLDSIARALHKELKSAEDTISFVTAAKAVETTTQLKFDLVKHIIDVRLAENEVKTTQRENALKKQKLLEILARKQDAALEGASLEELKAQIDAL